MKPLTDEERAQNAEFLLLEKEKRVAKHKAAKRAYDEFWKGQRWN